MSTYLCNNSRTIAMYFVLQSTLHSYSKHALARASVRVDKDKKQITE